LEYAQPQTRSDEDALHCGIFSCQGRARDIFDEENVRFYGGGIPEGFLDTGKVTDAKLQQLLNLRSSS
jgi:hypothetical protein